MTKPADQITWKELLPGCIVDEPGSASEYETGDWRSTHPEVDYEKCKKCGICWLFCPEACIKRLEDRRPEINMTYCKGCGICSVECAYEAITMSVED